MEFTEALPWNLLTPLLVVLGLGVLWLLLRLVMRVALRVFWVGCIGLVIVGILYVLANVILSGR